MRERDKQNGINPFQAPTFMLIKLGSVNQLKTKSKTKMKKKEKKKTDKKSLPRFVMLVDGTSLKSKNVMMNK